MKKSSVSKICGLVGISVVIVLSGCLSKPDYIPKPMGYLRIDLPEKSYIPLADSGCPFFFEVPAYASVKSKTDLPEDRCMKNILFGDLKATLHCTYLPMEGAEDFKAYSEYTRKLAYEHRVKAEFINQVVVKNPANQVYGVIYEIDGDVASNYLFYLSDSTHNYFAGSLYFFAAPNSDSIRPVLDFLKEDIHHLIETFHWKE